MNDHLTADMSGPSVNDKDGDAGPFVADMVRRWEMGERPSAQEYLAAHPELERQQDAALRLIYEEYCLREERGEELSKEEWLNRFPRWRQELQAILECHQLLDRAPHDEIPAVPPSLATYTLVAELGRGGQGRVYLARQSALDDRPVVLKISPRRGVEHLTLARLQHTGIVPLFAVEEDLAENTRILCMPYFGGATLKQLIVELHGRESQGPQVKKRRGHDLLAALDRLQAALPIQVPARGPARQFLAGSSREQAVAWIGWCLAEALQFAHERGYIHLDVKPANILLTAEGQPMLLDFHIAQPALVRGSKPPLCFGGTPLYMSPEQRAAVEATDLHAPLLADVDGRSDIFSLGLVLVEALGGKVPHDTAQRDRRPDLACLPVSTGLRDILARCLAGNPANRYPHAAALAEDLRRHVQDLPLKGVRNRSLVEQWRKWRRRRPASLPLALMTAAVLTAALALLLFTLLHAGDLQHQAGEALLAGKQQFQQRRFAEAVTTFQRGIQLGEGVAPGTLVDSLRAELDKARRAHLAEKLHALTDAFRFYGSSPNLQGHLHRLAGPWLTVWEQRAWLAAPAAQGLSLDDRERLKTDLLDLALLWADVDVRLAAPDGKRLAQKKALALLQEAEAEFGPSRVLSMKRQEFEEALGEPALAEQARQEAEALQPKTPWEHYALGRALLNQGKWPEAAGLFERSVELDPGGFWPTFYLGLCALERRDDAEAESVFRVCAALAPKAAACHYNRGLALFNLRREDQALAAFGRAFQLDAALGPPTLNRGILYAQAKEYQKAQTDFEHALTTGHEPAAIHYHLAAVHLAQGNRAAARAAAGNAVQADPGFKEARELLNRLEGK